MPYLWIFVGCYALAFVIVNMKLAAQAEHIKTRLRENGISHENFNAIFRQEMPLAKEMLIRIWAPFVFSVIPTGLLSLGYFLFL
jgi:hypothetical protein